jgi:predicted nuclease of restriction endonuclease-like RecB superfamily
MENGSVHAPIRRFPTLHPKPILKIYKIQVIQNLMYSEHISVQKMALVQPVVNFKNP